MHKHFVINIISRVILVMCFVMFAPLGWAIYDNIDSRETDAFLITILGGAILSVIFILLFKLKKIDYKKINAKDALSIVGLSWICCSAFGALPLYFSGVVTNYTDAFFEIASGFTTTGATIFTDIEILPRGILFWRSLTHWLGGMGIIVLYIALLPALGTNAFQLYKAEAPGLTVERVEPRLKETAKNLWTIYFLLTIVEVILLLFGKMPIFDALCHTFGTMATGGFSTKNASIAAYGPYIQWVITIFMFLSGMNFILHYQLMRGRVRAYLKDEEFRNYFYFTVIVIALFTLILSEAHVSRSPFRDSAFQVVSILTTTGFTTADFDLWPNIARFVLVMLMFIGGCGGSTGGGMKFIRVFLSIKIAFHSIVQTVLPNAILPTKFNNKALSNKLEISLLSYFLIFVLLFVAGTLLFVSFERCDLVTGLTASISALSNVGPGLSQIGPSQTFHWVSAPGKWLLIFLMLAGRLELFSILVLFIPSTWKK